MPAMKIEETDTSTSSSAGAGASSAMDASMHQRPWGPQQDQDLASSHSGPSTSSSSDPAIKREGSDSDTEAAKTTNATVNANASNSAGASSGFSPPKNVSMSRRGAQNDPVVLTAKLRRESMAVPTTLDMKLGGFDANVVPNETTSASKIEKVRKASVVFTIYFMLSCDDDLIGCDVMSFDDVM